MRDAFIAIAGSLLLAAYAGSHATLPPPTPEEKAAAAARAEKDAAQKLKAAKDLSAAQDRAAANYRKTHPSAAGPTTNAPRESPSGASKPSGTPGADHANSRPPDAELTRREAQTEMPKPGQANDHSTTARDPRNSSGRR